MSLLGLNFHRAYYNGVLFPPESKVDVRLSNVYDRAGRTVVSVIHSFTIKATFAEDTEDDQRTLLTTVRANLQAPGKIFRLTGTGFADVVVNASDDATKDVDWGPKPRMITWEPLGLRAAKVVWTCDVNIPVCDDAVFANKIMAHGYTVSISRDEQGYITRSISGYAQIPMTRRGTSKVPPDQIDNYWEQVRPPVPVFFRSTESRSFDESKRQLTYNVTQTEMPFENMLPPNVVECRASHTTTSQNTSLALQVATIRATYVMRKQTRKAEAFIHFIKLCNLRMGAMSDAARKTIIPVALTSEDPDIYGRTAASFSFSFRYQLASGIPNGKIPANSGSFYQKILKGYYADTALWTMHTDTYAQWAASMAVPMGARGNLQWREDSRNDPIVDLCDPATAAIHSRGGGGAFIVPSTNGTTPNVLVGVPKGQASYTSTRVILKVASTAAIAFAKSSLQAVIGGAAAAVSSSGFTRRAPTPPVPGGIGGRIDNNVSGSVGIGVGGMTSNIANTPLHQAVVRTLPTVTAVLDFDLIRCGEEPAIPEVSSIGNALSFVKTGAEISSQISGWYGVPMYRKFGRMFYNVTLFPQEIPGTPSSFQYTYVVGTVNYTGTAYTDAL